MKIRAFLAAFGIFAALLVAGSPALAAPAELTARSTAYADDWPPGDLIVLQAPSAAVRAEREDLADPRAYRQAGPVSKASHLFTAAGRFAAAHRSTRPGPS